MKKSGNAQKERCVYNLLSLTQGEIPLDQLRGIRSDVVDMPISRAVPFLQASAFSTIESYEPRVDFSELRMRIDSPADGSFSFSINK